MAREPWKQCTLLPLNPHGVTRSGCGCALWRGRPRAPTREFGIARSRRSGALTGCPPTSSGVCHEAGVPSREYRPRMAGMARRWPTTNGGPQSRPRHRRQESEALRREVHCGITLTYSSGYCQSPFQPAGTSSGTPISSARHVSRRRSILGHVRDDLGRGSRGTRTRSRVRLVLVGEVAIYAHVGDRYRIV